MHSLTESRTRPLSLVLLDEWYADHALIAAAANVADERAAARLTTRTRMEARVTN